MKNTNYEDRKLFRISDFGFFNIYCLSPRLSTLFPLFTFLPQEAYCYLTSTETGNMLGSGANIARFLLQQTFAESTQRGSHYKFLPLQQMQQPMV